MLDMIPYPKVSLRFELAPDLKLGPGKIMLLELIEQTGSISAAARAMNMSYRRAWLLIDELKSIVGSPVVATSAGGSGGGGATLTADGRDLIFKFRAVEGQTRALSAELVASLKTPA